MSKKEYPSSAETNLFESLKRLRDNPAEQARLDKRKVRDQRLQDPNQQKIELEMRKRLINAEILGRIVPEKSPNYIGNFDHDYSKGVFEMYIERNEGGNIRGTIEDVYGTATFEGVLSHTEISFTKHYIPEKSSVEASDSDLEYKGKYHPEIDKYLGRFVYKDHSEYGRTFSISRDLLSQLK